jgi:AcrR family transcriptional regulator
MGLRDDKKREMRAAIAATALNRFRSAGFDATRVQDIVRELRISEATFFNYFPTKQAVLEAAAAEVLIRAEERMRAAQFVDAPIGDRLIDLVEAFAADLGGDRSLADLLARHTQMFNGDETQPSAIAHRQVVTDLFADGQRRAEVRGDVPAERLAEMYEGIMLSAVRGWLQLPGDDQVHLAQRMREAVDVTLHGCEVRAGPSEAGRHAHRRTAVPQPT